MKKIILIAIVSVLSGCYGAQIAELRRQNAQLADENRRHREDYARRQGQEGQKPSDASTAGQMPMVGATSVTLARLPHGPYQGTIGAQSRFATTGPTLEFWNNICDPDSWTGFTCDDRDRKNGEDYNTYLAFVIDTVHPTDFLGSFYKNPSTNEMVLPPTGTGQIELGESCIVDVTIKAYRPRVTIVNGVKVIKFSENPTKTMTIKKMNACDGYAYQEFSQSFLR